MDMLVYSQVSAELECHFNQVLSWVQGSAEMNKGKRQGLIAGQGKVEGPCVPLCPTQCLAPVVNGID